MLWCVKMSRIDIFHIEVVMGNNEEERTPFAVYAGGNLNKLLDSLREGLGKISEIQCQDQSDESAASLVSAYIDILSLLNDSIFPLFSKGEKPGLLSSSVGLHLGNLGIKLLSLRKKLKNENEKQKLQDASIAFSSHIYFRAMKLIKTKFDENTNLSELLNFLDPSSIQFAGKVTHVGVDARDHTYNIGSERVFLGSIFEDVRDLYLISRAMLANYSVHEDLAQVDAQIIESASEKFGEIKNDINQLHKELDSINNRDLPQQGDLGSICCYYLQKVREIEELISNLKECKVKFREVEKDFILQVDTKSLVDNTFYDLNLVLSQEEALFSEGELTSNDSYFVTFKTYLEKNRVFLLDFQINLDSYVTESLKSVKSKISGNMSGREHDAVVFELQELQQRIPNDPSIYDKPHVREEIRVLIEKHQSLANIHKNEQKFADCIARLQELKTILIDLDVQKSQSSGLGTSSTESESRSSISSDSGSSNESPTNREVSRRFSLSSFSRALQRREPGDSFECDTDESKQSSQASGVRNSKEKKTWKMYLGAKSGETFVDSLKRRRSSVSSGTAEGSTLQNSVDDSCMTLREVISSVQATLECAENLERFLKVEHYLRSGNDEQPCKAFKTRYEGAMELSWVDNFVQGLGNNSDVRGVFRGHSGIEASINIFADAVKEHITNKFREAVKSKHSFDERVTNLRSKIASTVQAYKDLSDLNTVVSQSAGYEQSVADLQASCENIKQELHELREVMQMISEEVSISEDGLPDDEALGTLNLNFPLAKVLHTAKQEGIPVSEYVRVIENNESGQQEILVSSLSRTRNICHTSFIHRMSSYLFDSNSDVNEKVDFDKVIEKIRESQQIRERDLQPVLDIQTYLIEMDKLLKNKYSLSDTIASYLYEFISQPGENKTAENLSQLIVRCKHKLHSYDAEVAEQDKDIWDRKVTLVLSIIPIIGWAVLAVCYYYNKSNYGIGFFSWETTKGQDAQQKVEEDVDKLDTCLLGG